MMENMTCILLMAQYETDTVKLQKTEASNPAMVKHKVSGG